MRRCPDCMGGATMAPATTTATSRRTMRGSAACGQRGGAGAGGQGEGSGAPGGTGMPTTGQAIQAVQLLTRKAVQVYQTTSQTTTQGGQTTTEQVVVAAQTMTAAPPLQARHGYTATAAPPGSTPACTSGCCGTALTLSRAAAVTCPSGTGPRCGGARARSTHCTGKVWRTATTPTTMDQTLRKGCCHHRWVPPVCTARVRQPGLSSVCSQSHTDDLRSQLAAPSAGAFEVIAFVVLGCRTHLRC
jgi:hypothetical protein